MRAQFSSTIKVFALFLCLVSGGAVLGHAQSEPATPQATAGAAAQQTPDPNEETNEFRHAANVKAIARIFGWDPETTAQVFEWINSGILIFVILFFVAKIVPKAMRGRSALIQKKLVEARQETETANQRLSVVEARLAKIGEDIDAIRQQTERDSIEDEKRIKQSLEEERQRIVKSSEQEIESASAAAKRELKRFAAELAVDSATKRIQLSYESDKALVERFGQDLTAEFGKGGRN